MNEKIGRMVKRGFALDLQGKALDVLRVYGSDSVHAEPFVRLEDLPSTVKNLFHVMNNIVNQMITSKKSIEKLHQGIPQNKLDGIAKRNADMK